MMVNENEPDKNKRTFYYLEDDAEKVFYHTNKYNLVLIPGVTDTYWALWKHGKRYAKHVCIDEWFYCPDMQLCIKTGRKSRNTAHCYKNILHEIGLIEMKIDFCKFHNKPERGIVQTNNNRRMKKRVTYYRIIYPIPTLTIEGIKKIENIQKEWLEIRRVGVKKASNNGNETAKHITVNHNEDKYKGKTNPKIDSGLQNQKKHKKQGDDMVHGEPPVSVTVNHNEDYKDLTEDKKISPDNNIVEPQKTGSTREKELTNFINPIIDKYNKEKEDFNKLYETTELYKEQLKKETNPAMITVYEKQIEINEIKLKNNYTHETKRY